ncbi:MAG TPA: hypothetical protein VI322_05135 [Candidatus Saccharimonadia bacterium]
MMHAIIYPRTYPQTYPQTTSPQVSPRKTESRAIYGFALAFGLAAVVGLAFGWGTLTPLFGQHSVGNVASVVAAVAAFVTFWAAYRAPEPPPGVRDDHWAPGAQRWLTRAALAFIHAAIALLLAVVAFFLAQSGFQGLSLDTWSTAAFTGLAAGLAGYYAYLTGAAMTALRLSTSLAVFTVAGAMTSMITAPNPYWWQIHFSSLGTTGGASAATFNLTLTLAGLVMVCLADFVATDFWRLQQAQGERWSAVKVRTIRLIIAGIGLMLAGVGLFKADVYVGLHRLSAAGMAVLFIGLVAALRQLVPTFTKAFFAFSYGLVGLIFLGLWLWHRL